MVMILENKYIEKISNFTHVARDFFSERLSSIATFVIGSLSLIFAHHWGYTQKILNLIKAPSQTLPEPLSMQRIREYFSGDGSFLKEMGPEAERGASVIEENEELRRLINLRAPNDPMSLVAAMLLNPGNKFSVVDERVFIGSELQAADLQGLRARGITTVVNVPGDYRGNRLAHPDDISCNFFANSGIQYIEGNVADREDQPLDIPRIVSQILAALKGNNHRVLIHCKEGKSRSATIAIAYLMKVNNWTFSQAFETFKRSRKVNNNFNPNQGFINLLNTWAQNNMPIDSPIKVMLKNLLQRLRLFGRR